MSSTSGRSGCVAAFVGAGSGRGVGSGRSVGSG